MKTGIRTSSGIVALLCWVLTSMLTLFILWGIRDRARLIRDNDNERILNIIFTEFRGHNAFGSIIESHPLLSARIAGFAIYGEDLALIYRWGTVPPVFDEKILVPQNRNKFGRYTIFDRKGDKVKFILDTNTGRLPPPTPPMPLASDPAHRMGVNDRLRQTRQNFFINNFNLLANGTYLYIDISHPAYWRTQTLTAVLLPLCELALLAGSFYIRRLYLRNREYRERIEAQKNLVVLGTAASTLAHEIKNPLLSIRLQTGILRKLLHDQGCEELMIIDEEVERLSELIYRVNDYLREAEGNRRPINSYDLLYETAQRLCGRDILQQESPKNLMFFMDPYRARSVFENILRNALESGGNNDEVSVSMGRNNGFVVINIADRGKGIPKADMKQVFDPFFTRKSTGTGIGLSISKRFVEAAKGSIRIDAREGGGTLVRIMLPEWTAETEPEYLEQGVG
ncbi:MAG: sensor histidine kinase [Treponema sp.]|jgi:two-component system sensor histidine kinase HydH|nr:sensor histidine kinase [Treponema sp.]